MRRHVQVALGLLRLVARVARRVEDRPDVVVKADGLVVGACRAARRQRRRATETQRHRGGTGLGRALQNHEQELHFANASKRRAGLCASVSLWLHSSSIHRQRERGAVLDDRVVADLRLGAEDDQPGALFGVAGSTVKLERAERARRRRSSAGVSFSERPIGDRAVGVAAEAEAFERHLHVAGGNFAAARRPRPAVRRRVPRGTATGTRAWRPQLGEALPHGLERLRDPSGGTPASSRLLRVVALVGGHLQDREDVRRDAARRRVGWRGGRERDAEAAERVLRDRRRLVLERDGEDRAAVGALRRLERRTPPTRGRPAAGRRPSRSRACRRAPRRRGYLSCSKLAAAPAISTGCRAGGVGGGRDGDA